MNKHLGGHAGKTWIDEGALSYLSNTLSIKTMVDIGCGPAGMKDIAKKLGIDWTGVDGDEELFEPYGIRGAIKHDFTKGKVQTSKVFDVAWSVEFLEHVEEQYQDNYMSLFERCSFVICTAAPVGWGGHHHVNEQPREYWTNVFSKYGFKHNKKMLDEILKHSTMRKTNKHGLNGSFLSLSGMFFERV